MSTRRGTLRVYLGAAPGVGKTFAMLDEGWRRKDRGADVVVGYVETHGRPRTEAQLRDLEVVPRRRLSHRGTTFEEMDVDAVLARCPQQALVDELAHSNVTGSRNEKRWQDVEELLAAGIDVVTTVNIQHLESLNDVVAQITGVTQRETVPDHVVRSADQIELVDMSPEALRRRMAHGNIYAADKVDAALSNYFRVGNLAALRELALLWVADRVEESLHDYRDRHGISEPWETKERVLVALTGAPGGPRLIRRAARLAMRTKADLVGVHVIAGDGLATPDASALDGQRHLLEELGGRFREVAGADIAETLVAVARAENATQIVLGASHRTRLNEVLRGSIINKVIRASGRALDVHVISTDTVDVTAVRAELSRFLSSALPRTRRNAGVVAAVAAPVALTLALTPFRDTVGLQNAVLCFLLVVVAVAAAGGIVAAVVASGVAFACLNWFFTPPIHTFTIDRGRDVFSLVAFLITALVVSGLVDVAARRRLDATRARTEAESLGRMASHVLRARDPVPELLSDLASMYGLDSAAIVRRVDDHYVVDHMVGAGSVDADEHGEQTIPVAHDTALVLRGALLPGAGDAVLAAFAAQLGIALESRRLHAEAAGAEALAKANELRSALLAAVSHDLRSPLAAIKTAASSLLSEDVTIDDEATDELLRTIDSESDRLNALVENLLDMSRINARALPVHLAPTALEDVVAMSVEHDDVVHVDISPSVPRVTADGPLLERAVANMVNNARSQSPAGARIDVTAGAVAGQVELRIIDRGRGISREDRDRVFQPFQRLGDNPNGSGVGLGLAVSRGFIESMGGTLTVEDTPGGGCTMVVSLPIAGP